MLKYQILQIDTDGISLGVPSREGKTNKDQIVEKVKELEKRWQDKLNFPDFELDVEDYEFQIHVAHKNYVYGDINSPDDINLKGNNLKGKNKSKISEKMMKQIIFNIVNKFNSWDINHKEDIRMLVKSEITDVTNKLVDNMDMSTVKVEDLMIHEYVNPVSSYKKPDSLYALRTKAIEKLTGNDITYSNRFTMLVCKEPLPGISKVSKKGTKATHYLWPINYIQKEDIDLEWYQENVKKYVFGALGIKKRSGKSKKAKKENVIDKEQTTWDQYT